MNEISGNNSTMFAQAASGLGDGVAGNNASGIGGASAISQDSNGANSLSSAGQDWFSAADLDTRPITGADTALVGSGKSVDDLAEQILSHIV